MKVFPIILAAALGLLYGHYFYGFIFSSNICLFAGLALIMPTLFNVKLSDIKLAYVHKSVVLKSIVINYVVLPFIALLVGLATKDFGIAAGIFLLSVLSGGGMVMHWIKMSHGDTSIGFILLFMNLIFVSLSLLMLHTFGIYSAAYFGEIYLREGNLQNFAKAVIILLIIVPFVASRIIMYIQPFKEFISSKRSYISSISIFIIVFYLFGLQNSQQLIDVYEFQPELIYISIGAAFAFYGGVFVVAKYAYDMDSEQERAAFWHTVTRYITLALVISTFSIKSFGVSMLLPIMFAYVIQIPFAAYIEKSLEKKKAI